MKMTFYSNFLNHHQIPFCDDMYKRFGDDFKFVATEKIPLERIKGGYLTDFSTYPYLIESYLSSNHEKLAVNLGKISDVVIIGSASDHYIKERLKLNKLTFRYSERLFKKGLLYFFHPIAFIKRFKKDTLLRYKNVYMLSSSAYTPFDYSFYLAYPNKFFKWGYFPEFMAYKEDLLHEMKPTDHIHFLWAGRFIDWKQPLIAVKLIEKLNYTYPKIKLTMLGDGPEYKMVSKYIHDQKLSNISLKGAVSASSVRNEMEKAHIFLFTSNKEEGWGAVLNEAMNAGCLVMANYQIGAAPYLIKHQDNGIMYDGFNDLYDQALYYVSQPKLISSVGLNAYLTIKKIWNHEVATARFVNLCESLLSGKKINFDEGPISKAHWLSERSVRKSIKKR